MNCVFICHNSFFSISLKLRSTYLASIQYKNEKWFPIVNLVKDLISLYFNEIYKVSSAQVLNVFIYHMQSTNIFTAYVQPRILFSNNCGYDWKLMKKSYWNIFNSRLLLAANILVKFSRTFNSKLKHVWMWHENPPNLFGLNILVIYNLHQINKTRRPDWNCLISWQHMPFVFPEIEIDASKKWKQQQISAGIVIS